MRFTLFLLVNALLFVRPGEIVPELGEVPIYLICIVACLAASWPAILELWRRPNPAVPPILLCVFCLAALVPVSLAANGKMDEAIEFGFEFAKVLVYLVLFAALVDSTEKLRQLFGWLGIFAAVTAGLAVVQYHGAIQVSQPQGGHRGFVQDYEIDRLTGEVTVFRRMCGTGLFNDPNDLGLLLVTGILIALYGMVAAGAGLRRLLWGGALLLFGYALFLTHSRGSFLALLAGLGTLFQARYGWKRTVLAGAAGLPVLLVVFAGRMTDFSAVTQGTGASRVELWSDGLFMFKEAPLFGIGMNQFTTRSSHVAHNSFIHCYTELGFLGGTFFLGAFYLACFALLRLGRQREEGELDPELGRLHPFLLAVVVAYVAGIFFLSRSYVVPTYTILGLGVAALRLAARDRAPEKPLLGGRPLVRLAGVSLAFLLCAETFVRFFPGGR